MNTFDTFVMVDWAAGKDTGKESRADAIWSCVVHKQMVDEIEYHQNRDMAEKWLCELIETELCENRRMMIGFDFPFGYPKGFAQALMGSSDPLTLWNWFNEWFKDNAPEIENNAPKKDRFDLAGEINRKFAKEIDKQSGKKGPFWGNGKPNTEITGLLRQIKNKPDYHNPFSKWRRVECELSKGKGRKPFTCWQLAGAGAVGSQVMTGLPVLAKLRHKFKDQVAVWPFEFDRIDKAQVVLVEIWPSLESLDLPPRPIYWIKDAWQVKQMALKFATVHPAKLKKLLDAPKSIPEIWELAREEGWILGVNLK